RRPANAAKHPRRTRTHLVGVDVDRHFTLGRKEWRATGAGTVAPCPAYIQSGTRRQMGDQSPRLVPALVAHAEIFVCSDDDVGLITEKIEAQPRRGGLWNRHREPLANGIISDYRAKSVDLNPMLPGAGKPDLPF